MGSGVFQGADVNQVPCEGLGGRVVDRGSWLVVQSEALSVLPAACRSLRSGWMRSLRRSVPDTLPFFLLPSECWLE